MDVEMLFPGGVSKALILSYDDGPHHDRPLIQLLNQYNLKGTFHLNSGRLGIDGNIPAEEIKILYAGHEVSAHSVNHPGLTSLDANGILNEVVTDQATLEQLTGYPIRGMSYPFGDYDKKVIEIIRETGIEYARTVQESGTFSLPIDYLEWHPTIHQFGEAYYNDNDLKRDRVRMAYFFDKVTEFLKTDATALLYVWGHSWEFEKIAVRWNHIERFFALMSHQDTVCSMTHIALVDYLKAFHQLSYSDDGQTVQNSSTHDLFFRIRNNIFAAQAGQTIALGRRE